MNSEPPPVATPQSSGTVPVATAQDRALYDRYLPLVRRIAIKVARRLPSQVSVDDLIGAGWLGLVEAMRRRETIPGDEQFETYAAYRVKGAVLDYLRSLDPMTRKMRGAARQITGAIKMLTSRLKRAPTEEEIAGELGLDLDAYHTLLHEVSQADPTRIELTDVYGTRSNEAAPDVMAWRRELADQIAEAVEGMSDRLQLVLSLYYQEECTFREVGEVLGVTEARVCQLHAEAIYRIRAHLDISVEKAPKKKAAG
ncbi:MAG TPA: FliA/WhiG family RNA polymerase sigma factor, partial [Polyangiaceae bacterium]|nr:FliA/WhiG family RNA polymerase sigma factor [Polyangiaceae bacterium]